MAPTIWGEHAQMKCGGCQIQWKVNWQPVFRPPRPFPCWNCGNPCPPQPVQTFAGDLVEIDRMAYQDRPPQRDDIVAIGDQHGVRIKRIMAIPGQTVQAIDQRLHVDGQVMTSNAEWLIVHDDRHRHNSDSWWQPLDASLGDCVTTPTGFELAHVDANHMRGGLIYRHRSPYHHLVSDRVRDDYPANLNEQRELKPVDHLAVDAVIEAQVESVLIWWNWQPEGSLQQSLSLSPGIHRVRVEWRPGESKTTVDGDFVTANSPVGVRLSQGRVRLSELIIRRNHLYRIDNPAATAFETPLVIPRGHYFVIGDNIPASVDSRQQGTVPAAAILGRVRLPNPPQNGSISADAKPAS